MKEDLFIDIIKNMLPASSDYIGDDTAYIKDLDLILTQDSLIEDIHFKMSTTTPYELGHKSVAVNLSDIAAAGGIAKYLLISLSLPPAIDEDFIREFYSGVSEICTKYNAVVVGGDITGAEKISISVTVIGQAQGITPSSRKTAKIDDNVIATGFFGSSAAGLWLLENNTIDSGFAHTPGIAMFSIDKFEQKHKMPIPQMGFGRIIATNSQPTPTMMDASDGLADALYKISKASNVSMEINLEKVPFHPDLKQIAQLAEIDYLQWVFFGGEDYQLVACVDDKCLQTLQKHNVPVRTIGKVIQAKDSPAVYVISNTEETVIIDQNLLDSSAFNHFKR